MRLIGRILVVVALLAPLTVRNDGRRVAHAQPSSPFAGKYLMAFDECDTSQVDCRSPRNDRVRLARSDDGRTWQPIPEVPPFAGNVPDLLRRGNTLYVYYLTFGGRPIPEVLNVRRYDVATGALRGQSQVTLEGSNGTPQAIVDPSPTIDRRGRIVLFGLARDPGGDPGGCPPDGPPCTKRFLSFTEVAGSNGTRFVVDEGSRFEIVLPPGDGAADPDILKGPDGYLLYMQYARLIDNHKENNVLAASSDSLHGAFALIPGLPEGVLSSGQGGVPAGHHDEAAGRYWLYVHYRPPGAGDLAVIRRAVHAAVDAPVPGAAFETVIAGDGFPGLGPTHTTESPGFTVNEVVAAVDVKPGSCPNPINTRGRGVLPVAILGAPGFAVSSVDATSVRLEGIAPERAAVEDTAAPFQLLSGKNRETDCTTAGPDGIVDLSLKFDQAAVAEAAETRLGPLADGQVVTLRLTAQLHDGGSLVGEDVVILRR